MDTRARLAILLGGMALAACGQPPVSYAQPTFTPSPPPTALNLGPCRLPVASGDAPVDGHAGDGTTGHGGFIQFPQATFSPDSGSLGDYDRQVSHWVPVTRAWVEPDGARYAWTDGTMIHVVDAASGVDHPVAVPGGPPVVIVSFEAEGIYIARQVGASGTPPQGLAFLDAAGNGYRQIVTDGTWTAIGGGFAYSQDGGPPPNRVRKVDVHSGAVSDFNSYPGAQVQVIGATDTAPLIAVTSGSTYTVFAGPSVVFAGPVADTNPSGPVVVDGPAVWFSSQNGVVWHWDGSGRAAKAASPPLHALLIAGGCH